MRKLLAVFYTLFIVPIFGFEQSPWLGNFLEFHLIPSFTYRYYPSVNRGFNPNSYSSNDKFTKLEVGTSFLPSWDAQVGVEFAATRRQTLGTQSGALQVRYQWYNDIGGDFLSWTNRLKFQSCF